ncbi:MAG: glycosyltransferase family 2 protein [Candidatus Binatia bacterium]
MTESLSVAIPCRADEPDLETTLNSLAVACGHTQLPPGLVAELIVCINGLQPAGMCASLLAVREFCARQGIAKEEVWVTHGGQQAPDPVPTQKVTEPGNRRGGQSVTRGAQQSPASPLLPPSDSTYPLPPFPRCTILLTERSGKPPAWNMLWRQSQGALVLFADADVRVEEDAVVALCIRMQCEPQLRLVAAREVPMLQDGGTLWSRMGAIPYRFNFGNAGGRLLLIRKDALVQGMPEDLLLEDAWLTVAVGRMQVAKELAAKVYFLPPATARDYVAERIRTEGGKLQIRRQYRQLLAGGPIAHYRWADFWREISVHEYPLIFLALLMRIFANGWARLALTRKDFYALYRPFTSTKGWGRRKG